MKSFDEEYKEQFKELLDEYLTASNIPFNKQHHIAEVLRAKYVLQKHGNENHASVLSQYGVGAETIKELTGFDGGFVARKEKRSDKYAKILAWCKEHVGQETNVYEIAEVGEVSYPTANNFVKDRVDLFTKVKKGQYIVRDPESDRAAEKQASLTTK